MKNIFLSLGFLLLLFPHGAEAVNPQCFHAFHQCNVTNKGQFKLCQEKMKVCEAEAKAGGPSAKAKQEPAFASQSPMQKQKLRSSCFQKFHTCNVKNRGQLQYCLNERKACENPVNNNVTSKINPASEPQAHVLPVQPAQAHVLPAQPRQAMPRAPVVVKSQEPAEAQSCYTISMAKKACIAQEATYCSRFSNTFAKKTSCDTCFNDYRQPMEKHMLTIYMTAQQVKFCKPKKRDHQELAKCQKTVPDAEERAVTLKYLNAQLEIDRIVAQAKSSGIKGCGNFTRIH